MARLIIKSSFFKNNEDFKNYSIDIIEEFKKEFAVYPEWIKIDFITKKISIEFQNLRKNLSLFLKMIMSDTNISSSYIARTTYYKNVDTVFMLMI
ncbi:hypothetical protein HMPREF3029_06130 [Nosocomiicoccus sp. HMSC059G07]|nr:hypothetical protein HMPREF3029_06130 [Nosocomiicoccus sp. HMSC059G07]